MVRKVIYNYPPLLAGKLISRYKRFFADIELTDGTIITAHCPNTGPMIGVSTPGSLVQVSQSNNPKRKLAYTWEMILVENTWVGINTALPNKIIKLALEQKLFPELVYDRIRCEVPYGKDKKSRIDFLLESDDSQLPIYIEVKNVTLAQDNLALFPDTVTTRGQKHLQELIALLPIARSIMLYFIARSDCDRFAPSFQHDAEYTKLFQTAVAAGVEILPCRFAVTPEGISYLGLANII
jgi:sugar fermentation stimulation protein A